MRTLLLAGVLAVAGFAIATPISIAPASAQVAVDTPLGGVRVGPERRYYREYDRPAYRAYGYDRGYRGGCRTVTIERDDGSVRRIRRCDKQYRTKRLMPGTRKRTPERIGSYTKAASVGGLFHFTNVASPGAQPGVPQFDGFCISLIFWPEREGVFGPEVVLLAGRPESQYRSRRTRTLRTWLGVQTATLRPAGTAVPSLPA